ncbi:MAG: PilZ domain-containing protein, partial [Nitrospirota bacterium]
VVSSKAFSLMDSTGASEEDSEQYVPEDRNNAGLYSMMTEIKTKLDFIINHLMLDQEGLVKSGKKFVNISASGIRFTVDHQVGAGEIMEIKLLLPTYPPVAVFAYGEVKRVKKTGDGKYEVALEYLNMDDSVRNEIIQYTLSHQRETIRKIKESENK